MKSYMYFTFGYMGCSLLLGVTLSRFLGVENAFHLTMLVYFSMMLPLFLVLIVISMLTSYKQGA